MKKRTNGLWLGLAGLVVGLALGYLGSGLVSNRSLLGSPGGADNMSVDTLYIAVMGERQEKVEREIGDLIKSNKDKKLSQEDAIKLQALMNKRNQAEEMAANLLKKLSDTQDIIISNMR